MHLLDKRSLETKRSCIPPSLSLSLPFPPFCRCTRYFRPPWARLPVRAMIKQHRGDAFPLRRKNDGRTRSRGGDRFTWCHFCVIGAHLAYSGTCSRDGKRAFIHSPVKGDASHYNAYALSRRHSRIVFFMVFFFSRELSFARVRVTAHSVWQGAHKKWMPQICVKKFCATWAATRE